MKKLILDYSRWRCGGYSINMVGQKLHLEVEVVDSDMTPMLLRWLLGASKDGERIELFGCKLDKINFNNPRDETRKKLIEFAKSLEE